MEKPIFDKFDKIITANEQSTPLENPFSIQLDGFPSKFVFVISKLRFDYYLTPLFLLKLKLFNSRHDIIQLNSIKANLNHFFFKYLTSHIGTLNSQSYLNLIFLILQLFSVLFCLLLQRLFLIVYHISCLIKLIIKKIFYSIFHFDDE